MDRDPLRVRFVEARDVLAAAEAQRPQMVFFGSSMFDAAVNTAELQHGFQEDFGAAAPRTQLACFSGADPFVHDFILDQMHQRGVQPDVAVVEVSPETVMLGGPFQDFQMTRLLSWRDMPGAIADIVAYGKRSRFLSSRLIPVYLYRKELMTHLFGAAPPYLYSPEPPAPSAPASPSAGQERIRAEKIMADVEGARRAFNRRMRNFRIQGMNARHLESMLGCLKARGVPTILVAPPLSQVHNESYAGQINREFFDYMGRLCQTDGCTFVDYRTRLNDDQFRDHSHTSAEGGVAFTRLLYQEVLKDAWRKRRSSQ